MLDAVERMAQVTDLPLSAQPNAGLPRAVGDRKIYLASPEYMAQYARRMIEAGARFVGGCCGTSPEHIRSIRALVGGVRPPSTRVRPGSHAEPHDTPIQPDVPLGERSAWGRKIAEASFVTSIEITPPKGWDAEDLLGQCRRIQAAGADTVNVLDHPHAHARMSALPAAMLIEREVGIETIVHYPCRDRNMTRMISDLLGAAAAGPTQSSRGHRAPAHDGSLPRLYGHTGHRLDRTHQRGPRPESRRRPRGQRDRRTHALRHRGEGEPGRRGPRP